MAYIKEFPYEEQKQNTRNSKAVLDKWSLTGPRMDVLRRAARPCKYSADGEAHDGQISTYGVMDKTLAALRSGGFIGDEYELTEDQRIAAMNKAMALITEAHAIFHNHFSPFEVLQTEDGLVSWKVVLADLRVAEAKLKVRDTKVTRITAKGREAVAEFLGALGIVEE